MQQYQISYYFFLSSFFSSQNLDCIVCSKWRRMLTLLGSGLVLKWTYLNLISSGSPSTVTPRWSHGRQRSEQRCLQWEGYELLHSADFIFFMVTINLSPNSPLTLKVNNPDAQPLLQTCWPVLYITHKFVLRTKTNPSLVFGTIYIVKKHYTNEDDLTYSQYAWEYTLEMYSISENHITFYIENKRKCLFYLL